MQIGDFITKIGSTTNFKSLSKKSFIFGNSYTRMIFKFENVEKSSEKILNLIKENKNITIAEIAQKISL